MRVFVTPYLILLSRTRIVVVLWGTEKADVDARGVTGSQHLELAAKLARSFNRQYDTDFFTVPNPLSGSAVRTSCI